MSDDTPSSPPESSPDTTETPGALTRAEIANRKQEDLARERARNPPVTPREPARARTKDVFLHACDKPGHRREYAHIDGHLRDSDGKDYGEMDLESARVRAGELSIEFLKS